jgi:GNAT superfamily N-acetyltransferase
VSTDAGLIVDIEHTWAEAERRIVDVVARLEPGRGAMTFDLADGVAVLAGPGLYVNQAMGAGLTQSLTSDDLDHLEEHATEVGVAPAVDVCDATLEAALSLLQARSYEPDDTRAALVHDLAELAPLAGGFTVEQVDSSGLPAWQQATAEGWGHVEAAARAASDLYGAAAAEVDRPGPLIARSDDGEVAGVAMLRIEGSIATLGAMSTRPAWRRRGVQSVLVNARLRMARDAGCRVATSSVVPASGSHRNLERAGFRLSHRRTTWRKVNL